LGEIPLQSQSLKKESPVKISRISALTVLVLLLASAAFADSFTDPKIIIQGVNGGSFFNTCPPGGCEPVGTKFSFTSPAQGSGKLFFTNASGKDWTSLRLIESGVPAGAITCIQGLFTSCTVKTLKNGATEILLSGVAGGDNPHHGIRAGQSFAIGFKCDGKDCWPGGLAFHAIANAPEPATIALMTTGVAAIVSRRKRWKRRAEV
jgi:hypothetical protein